ncbi:hypothetical protein J4Q44_G00088210 [Coregonus suidteri]|uniref:Uncharacterized protein n=1 Tax=Coregonus suidteri TaxID=861788 RepID=A0AAN8QZ43_9TELE
MERLWSYLRKFGKITKEMTPSHRVALLTPSPIPSSTAQPGSGRSKSPSYVIAPAIQLRRQKVLKEETEAKEELMVLLNSIPG